MGRLVWFGVLALPGPVAVAALLLGAAISVGAGFAAGRHGK